MGRDAEIITPRMLELQDVCKTFFDPGRGPVRALDHLSLSIAPGVTALVGANGAGKSTLLRCIATLLTPDAGHLRWEGLDAVHHAEELRRRLGYLSTTTRLSPRLTPWEILSQVGGFYGLRGSALKTAIDAQVDTFDLGRFLHQRLDGLSTGERQRVNLARTLVADPGLVVLDEPTTGLDLVAASRMATAVEAARRPGRLLLLATHHLPEVERLADRLLVLDQGRLVFDGPPGDLGHGAALHQAILGMMHG